MGNVRNKREIITKLYFLKKNILSEMLSKKLVLIILFVYFVIGVLAITITNISPTTNITTSNSNQEITINFSTNGELINEIKWSWDNTNYTFYDNSLVLFYNFDNRSSLSESSTVVEDLSNRGNNATVSGAIFNLSYGKYNGAYQFDGTNDYINTSLNPLINNSNFTIAFWFRATTPDRVRGLISTQNISEFNNKRGVSVNLETTAAGRLQFYVGNTTVLNYSRSVSTYADNVWRHGTFLYDGLNIKIFINAVEVAYNVQGTVSNFDTGVYPGLDIGQYAYQSGVNRNLNGSIDDMMVWNRSLSTTEISQLYKSQLTKYDTQNWTFWTNQTLNNSISNSTYTKQYPYYLCASNSSEYEFCSNSWVINSIPSMKKLTTNFSNSFGTIREDFYGITDQFFQLGGYSNLNLLDTNCDNVKDTPSNVTLNQQVFDNSGMKYFRIWDYMIYWSSAENTYNDTRIKWLMEQAEYANSRGYRIVFSQLSGWPYWLQNRTCKYCNSTDWNSCPPTNNTKAAILLNRIITNLTQVIPEDRIDVEIMNEPWGNSWLNNGTNTERVEIYADMFEVIKDYLKQQHPNISIGWVGTYDSSAAYFYRTQGLITNLTNSTDFIYLHAYPYDYITTNTLYTNLKNLSDTLDIYSVSPKPRLGFSEWNVWSGTSSWNYTRYAAETVYAYQSILNYNPTNVSLMLFAWSNWQSYTCPTYWPDYPLRFAMWIEVDNFYASTYNVTKYLGHLCSVGATVRNISVESPFVKVRCDKGKQKSVIVINPTTTSYNLTINLTNSGITTLKDYLNHSRNFTSGSSVIMDGYNDGAQNNILYLTEDLQAPSITTKSPVNNYNYSTNTIDFNISLDEEGSWCGLSLDGSTNIPMTKQGVVMNFYLQKKITYDIYHIAVITCNDTENNINSTSISFSILSNYQQTRGGPVSIDSASLYEIMEENNITNLLNQTSTINNKTSTIIESFKHLLTNYWVFTVVCFGVLIFVVVIIIIGSNE